MTGSTVTCPIEAVKIVPVFVRDQEVGLAFFRDVLGFVVKNDVTFGDRRWIAVTAPGSQTQISVMLEGDVPYDAKAGVGPGIALSTRDVAGARATFAERGAQVGELVEEPWGTYFMLQGPDGNEFVISSADED